MFQRVRTGSKIGAQYDQEGNLIKVPLKTKHLNPHVRPFAFADSFFVFKVMHSVRETSHLIYLLNINTV